MSYKLEVLLLTVSSVLAVASADGAHIALINPSDGSLIKVINTVRVVLGVPLMILYVSGLFADITLYIYHHQD